MAYADFKDFTRRTPSDKILHDKAIDIAKNPKYDGCQRVPASMVYKSFDKKKLRVGIKNENMSNKELAEELHKPINRKSKQRKVYSSFINNIWGADLADIYMQLISKFHKRICFLLFLTDIFSKYGWFIPLKDKKSITITNAFQKILDESSRKRNKIWVDKGSELDNGSIK